MLVAVTVKTEAKKDAIEALASGRLRVSVKAVAERGAANRRVIELVAERFQVPRKCVRIMKGHRTPSKILAVAATEK